MNAFRSLVCLMLLGGMAASAPRAARAQEEPWSQRAAQAAIARWPDGRLAPSGARWAWNYESGTLLEGMDAVWLNTADRRYFN